MIINPDFKEFIQLLNENEESKVIALRNAIQEGQNNSRVKDFNFDENLIKLKSEKEHNENLNIDIKIESRKWNLNYQTEDIE